MGRGRGEQKNSQKSRSLLLGKNKKETNEFLIETEKEGITYQTIVDQGGTRIIRDLEKDKWVERIVSEDGGVTTVFAYREELENNLFGDNIVIKEVQVNADGVEKKKTKYLYSDQKTELIRNSISKSEPIIIIERDSGLISDLIYQYMRGSKTCRIEKTNTSKRQQTKIFIDGKLNDINDEAAVTIYTDDEIIDQYFYSQGSPESVDNRPSRLSYNLEGQIVRKIWSDSKDEPHRIGAPASVSYENEIIGQEIFFEHGKLKNSDGPVIIDYEDGVLKKKHYAQDIPSSRSPRKLGETITTKTRADGGPGEEKFFPNGKIYSQSWYETTEPTNFYVATKMSRAEGPAYIQYYSDGKKELEEFYLDGKLHRIGGPAQILYNQQGKIVIEKYFSEGNEITEPISE